MAALLGRRAAVLARLLCAFLRFFGFLVLDLFGAPLLRFGFEGKPVLLGCRDGGLFALRFGFFAARFRLRRRSRFAGGRLAFTGSAASTAGEQRRAQQDEQAERKRAPA